MLEGADGPRIARRQAGELLAEQLFQILGAGSMPEALPNMERQPRLDDHAVDMQELRPVPNLEAGMI